MAKTQRRLSYEEFVRSLPQVLDEIAQDDEAVLVEKNGTTFSITTVGSEPKNGLPPLPPLEVRLEALRKSAGALKGVDVEELKADLREMRQQDSKGRPG
jgi:hypothetical protein